MLPKYNTDFFQNNFKIINEKVESIDNILLKETAELFFRAHSMGGKIIFVGNGGSAAMASHLSVDLTKTAGIRAINFNEADLLTCFANDYGYEKWVVYALKAYADKNDVVVVISSSGKSPNIINGTAQAKEMNLSVVTLSGFNYNNPLRSMGNINLWCDSQSYNVVELTHQTWLLSIVDYIIHAKGAK
jgi:D-sedoheptulose 7-phosphate isomerase